MNQYEAMFLFDPAAAPDFAKAKEEVERILGRAEAETVFLEKWDERKLAYEIKGCKRGLYLLCYFKCDGDHIVALERDVSLSESVLRVLITRAEGVTSEQMERFMPQKRVVVDTTATAGEGTAPAAPAEGTKEKVPASDGGEAAAAPAEGAVAVASAPAPAPEVDPERKAEAAPEAEKATEKAAETDVETGASVD